MQVDGDGELRLLEIGVGGDFIELGSPTAVAADGKIAEALCLCVWGSICAPE